MMEQLIEMMEGLLEQDKLFELGAKGLKKSVDALVNEGFTREEAVKIVANQGMFVKGSN